MSITCGNLLVTHLILSMPKSGAWGVDFEVATTDPNTGQTVSNVPTTGQQITLSIQADAFGSPAPFIWRGTVYASLSGIVGRQQIRAFGGVAGGYIKTIPAQQFSGPSAKTVITAMLAAGGEILNASLSNASVLASRLPSWQVFADRTLGQNLSALADKLGCSWRIDPTTGGCIFVIDNFNTIASMPSNSVIQEIEPDGDISYWCPGLDQLPMPGQVAPAPSNIQINEVMINADDKSLYVELFNQQGSLLFPTQPIQIDLSGKYSCTVTAQNPDSTLNLTPDDPSIAPAQGLQNVKIKMGASSTWLVKAGARADVAFENGDPSFPFVMALDGWIAGDYLTTITYGNPAIAQFVTRDDLNQAVLSALETYLNSHTHPTGVGPSGPPIVLWTGPTATACLRIKSD